MAFMSSSSPPPLPSPPQPPSLRASNGCVSRPAAAAAAAVICRPVRTAAATVAASAWLSARWQVAGGSRIAAPTSWSHASTRRGPFLTAGDGGGGGDGSSGDSGSGGNGGVTPIPASEFIRLEAFLKAQSVAPTGGQAKLLIRSGGVVVNGRTELRRGRKLRGGDVVEVEDEGVRMTVVFDADTDTDAAPSSTGDDGLGAGGELDPWA